MSEGREPDRPQDPIGGWSAPSGPPSYPPASEPTGAGGSEVPASPVGSGGAPWPSTPPAGGAPPGFAGSAPSGAAGGGGGSKTWIVALVALLVGLLVGGGIGWAVGGGDGAASGDGVAAEWQPFCDRADELVAMDDVELDDEEEAAIMAELAGLAPERYRDRLDALTQLGEMEDSDDLGAAFGMFGEVFGQLMWLVGTLQVECGIDPEVEGFDSGFDMSGDWSFDTDLDGDPEAGTGAGSLDDPFDDGDDDPFDDEDDGPMSLSALQDLVEEELPDVYDRLSSWSVFNDEVVEVDSYSGPLGTDEAMAVCEVLVDHLAEHAPDGTVDVLSEGEVMASGPAGGPCTAG